MNEVSGRLASLPGVAQARRWAERAFAPRLRADVLAIQAHLESLQRAHHELVQAVQAQHDRITRIETSLHETEAALAHLDSTIHDLRATVDQLEPRLALIGDSVATSNSLARRVQRELDRIASLAPPEGEAQPERVADHPEA